MSRLVPVIALLLAPAAVSAQTLDAESNKEYELQVLLRCGAHPWLSKAFRADLREELEGMMIDVLGPMARVGVFDVDAMPWPRLWEGVDDRGFAAMERPRVTNGAKTQFIRIDLVNGQYEVQSRQLDGPTSQVSPWRRERTGDRTMVAGVAGRVIGEDLGV